MNFKKFISGVSALTIAASAFAGMAVTANAADPVVVYERGTSAETAWSSADTSDWTGNTPSIDATLGLLGASGSGGRTATKSITVDENALLQLDMVYYTGNSYGDSGNYTFFRFGNNIEIRTSSQAQYGKLVVGTSETAIPNACSNANGNRGAENWTISMTVDTAESKITALSIVGTTGTTPVNYTITDAVSLPAGTTFTSMAMGSVRTKGTPGGEAITSIKLTQTAQEVQTAAYTVNYVVGETTLKTETPSGVVGAEPIIDMADFKVNGAKYSCASNDVGEKKILADGSLVITVSCTEIPAVTQATVNYISGGSTVATETAAVSNAFVGESYTVPYRRYVAKDGVLYQSTRTNNEFRKNVTLATPTVVNIDVTAVTVAEGETFVAVADGDGDSSNTASARASYGEGKRGTLVIADVQPGIYKIVYPMYLRKQGNGPELFLDDTSLGLITTGTSWTTDVTFENIEVTTAGTLSIHNCDMMDTVVLYKTGDIQSGPSAEVTEISYNQYEAANTAANDQDITAAKILVTVTGSIDTLGLKYNGGSAKYVQNFEGLTNANIVLGAIVPGLATLSTSSFDAVIE